MWHHSLLLMYSFNKTEAAVFSCRLISRGKTKSAYVKIWYFSGEGKNILILYIIELDKPNFKQLCIFQF